MKNALREVFVGRQPIYDRHMNVVAYELLFRNNGKASGADVTDGDAATFTVLTNTLIEIGLENVCGNRPAFINFTRGFIEGRFPIPVERDRIVIEVLESEIVDAPLLEGLHRLKEFGFRIALDDFQLTPQTRPLLDVADIVKLDIQQYDRRELADCVNELKTYSVTLLAEKVETLDEFERCIASGFDLFQGYFLSRPRLITGQSIPKNRLAVVQLMAKVQNPDIEFGELEKLVCLDVSLSVRLLQLVNSSAMSLPRKVDSIKHALVLLGIARVRNLVTLLSLAGTEDASRVLLGTALVRAKMCEQLGGWLNGNRDAYFTVGLLSSLDLFLQQPLAEIIRSVPLSEDVLNALLNSEGGMGSALQCALSFEQGGGESAQCLFLEPELLAEAYLAAVAWTEGTGGIVEQVIPEPAFGRPSLMAVLDERHGERPGSRKHHIPTTAILG